MENVRELIPSVRSKEKMHFKIHDRHFSVDPEKILFCKADGSYTKVVIEGNCPDILVSKRLNRFQRDNSKEMFLRCHYSYLVNIKKVQSFDSLKKSIVLEGYNIPVSRRKSNHVFRILSDLGIPDVKN